MAAISEGLVSSRVEFERMHFDERIYLAVGLAQLMRVKHGGGVPIGADSSAGVTMDSGDGDPLEGIRAMGVQVRTEGASE